MWAWNSRRDRRSARQKRSKWSRLFLEVLESRDVPDGGPLGPLQPPALGPIVYATNAAGLPLLHGLPSARASMFIDFDGYVSSSRNDLPYDIDGSAATFNATEQAQIVECWRQLGTYYAMFDVDVTTEQPAPGRPAAWLVVSNSISGGFSNVNAYPNSVPVSFNQSSDARTRQSGITHEFGHNFGLNHVSDYDLLGAKVNEYSSGFDIRHAPIMGVDYAQNVHKWFMGHPTNSPSALQDDLAIIAARIRDVPTPAGDGFRPDDHGDTTEAVTLMQSINDVPYGWGTIERTTDVDAFSFTVTDGTYAIAGIPNTPSGVDLRMEVYSSSGTLLAAADGPTNDQQVVMNLSAGTYSVLLSSHGDYGDLGAYFVTARPLPSGWDSRNIGNVIDAGFAGTTADGAFSIGGAGGDIGSTSDQFRYTYTTLTGNGSITARVASQENSATIAKAGVMVRESLDANSRLALMSLTPANSAVFKSRTSTGGSTSTQTRTEIAVPYWVRLTRTNNVLTGFVSADGVTWSQVASPTVNMASTVFIGLVVCAGNTGQANPLSDATFDNVALTGTLGTPPPSFNGLPAPTNLSLARGAGSGIDLTWDGVGGATGYAVERSADNVSWSQIATPSSTTYSDTSLSISQRYFYRVSALDAAGRSAPSPALDIVNRPGAPTNLTITSWKADTLILNWRDTSGDTGYRVEQSADGSNWTTAGTVGINVPSFTVSGLTIATPYNFRIIALSPLGDGPASAALTGSTRLASVTGLRYTASGSNRIDVAWDAVVGATSYRVQRSTDGATFTTVGNPSGSTYADTAVSAATGYYYRVVGVNSLTESLASATVYATTPPATTPAALPWGGAVTLNGATVVNGRLRLTDGTNQARSAFSSSPQLISRFSTAFTFQITNPVADGFTFTIQGGSPTAIGPAGAGLGYGATAPGGTGGLPTSLAVKFDIFNNRGEGSNSTGVYTNGASPTTPANSLGSAVDLRSGHVMQATINYDGSNLELTITDTLTSQTFTRTYTGHNLPALVGGSTAYVGFTAGTGGNSATQEIISWTYTPTMPATVQSVFVNADGGAQRSMVTNVVVTFDKLVSFAGPLTQAFTLTRLSDGAVIDFVASQTLINNGAQTQVTLTGFAGTAASNGSLADGQYALRVLSAQVSANGTFLDGNGDGTGAGTPTDDFVFADGGAGSASQFYRLFGDANGDRVVNGADLTPFILSFGGTGITFDFNGDGVVNGADVTAFIANFARSV